MLKHGILGLLNYGPSTGYDINELFKSSLNYFWTAQKSQIYRELTTMEGNGWLRRQTVAQEGRVDKNLCFITPEGKEEFLRWLNDSKNIVDTRSALLMRVFFFGERSREENIAFFKQYISECESYLASYTPIEHTVESYGEQLDTPEKADYWLMTVDYGKASMRANIEWAKNCLKKLEESK